MASAPRTEPLSSQWLFSLRQRRSSPVTSLHVALYASTRLWLFAPSSKQTYSRDASRAGFEHLIRIRPRHSTNRQNRNLYGGDHLSQGFQADSVLAGGIVYRAEHDEVCACLFSGDG